VFGDEDGLCLSNISEAKRDGKLLGGFAQYELVTFADDGRLLVTANGASVRVWDIASKQLVQIIDAYGSPIVGLGWLPASDLLVVASQNGRIRMWGRAKAGEALGMQPMHAATNIADPAAKQPATPVQLQRMIDLRTFPRLSGGSPATGSAFTLMYTVSVSAEEAMSFYRYHLGQESWKESTVADATPGSLQFKKSGFMISAAFYEGGESKTSVNISFTGNYDLRWVPKFDGAPIETAFENADTVMYRTQADLVQIETELLRKLHESGWTAFARLHSSHNETEDSRDLAFLRDGVILRVTIGRFPVDPTSYIIQYGRFLTQGQYRCHPTRASLNSMTQPHPTWSARRRWTWFKLASFMRMR